MKSSRPILSIVVVFHNMVREAPRTLYSLGREYQQRLVDNNYEIVAIDNGSDQPLDPRAIATIDPPVRYHRHDTSSPSPAAAVNIGVGMAEGDLVAVIVDGARMSSPGLVGHTQRAAALTAPPFVAALSWHLGPAVQNESMLDGYSPAVEDRLLEEIRWPENGYALFNISTLAQSSRPGFLGGVPPECSWWALRRSDFEELGGFDERFNSPGGGLVNHDFRNRVMTLPGISPIVILGEGVFHQFHGGVATNVSLDDHPIDLFQAEYEQIRSAAYAPAPTPPELYHGSMREEARRFLAH